MREKTIEERVAELEARVNQHPQGHSGTSQDDFEEYFGQQSQLDRVEERLEALIQFLSESHPDLLPSIGASRRDAKTDLSPEVLEEADLLLEQEEDQARGIRRIDKP